MYIPLSRRAAAVSDPLNLLEDTEKDKNL